MSDTRKDRRVRAPRPDADAKRIARRDRSIQLRAATGIVCEGLEARMMFATVTWVGGTGNWSTASNWSSNPSLPGASDDVVILAQVEYPDASTGNPSTNAANVESYAYDALNEQTSKTQRTGSVHQYSRDALGRMTSDNVVTLGSGVYGAIRREDYSFDTGGRLYQATSFSDTNGTTIINQVQRDYNGLGQITREWQSPTGAVNTSPGTSQTLFVQYAYSEMSDGSGGYANHSRLISITYPFGDRSLNYVYNGNAGLDNAISRLSALTQTIGSGTSAVTTTLEGYDYLGVGTVVQKTRGNGVNLTFEQQSGDTNAAAVNDGGDIYSGLDRFGRVVDQNWLNTNSGTNLTSADRFQYGFDQNSNVLYRKNVVSSANSELYHANGTSAGYDSLNRLTDFSRGTLNAGNDSITGSPSATRSWSLDAQGNWAADASGNAYAVNGQNQYTTLTGTGGGTATVTLNFAYDNDGNMTTRVDGGGLNPSGTYTADAFSFDAWDRLAVGSHRVTGSPTVGYDDTNVNYDALGRPMQVVVTGVNYGSSTPSDNLYYSTSGQVLEDDRVLALNGGTPTGWTRSQYVWSPTYANDLVLRDRDTNHDNTFAERLYVQQDSNHNVTAITDTSGVVQERFVYDPYGSATTLSSTWSATSDALNWQYLFQGGRYDLYTNLYHFGQRDYDPALGRWMQQDPTGTQYVDGADLYQFVRGGPAGVTDPSGLACADQKVDWWKLLRQDPDFQHAMKVVGGTLQVVGGAAEFIGGLAIVGAGGIPLGVGMSLHGIDNLRTGLDNLLGDGGERTLTAQGLTNIALWAHVDPKTAEKIGTWGDVVLGVAGGIAASRMGSGAAAAASEAGGAADALAEAGGQAERALGQELGSAAPISPIGCFIAGTQVVTGMRGEWWDREAANVGAEQQDGATALAVKASSMADVYVTQPIETFRAGDVVLARDQYDVEAPIEWRPIEEVFVRTAYQLTIVTLRSSSGQRQTLYTTNEHPVYVPERGWVVARELEVGDELLEPDGGVSTVVAAESQRHPNGIAVYNFRVAESHTYFVQEQGSTAEPVWVHNAPCAAEARAAQAAEDANALKANEVTTFGDANARRVVGDNLEAHELWQHANLKANNLATERLSTAASKGNPVVMLDKSVHKEVSIAQQAWDAAKMTPTETIDANATLLRLLNAAPESSVSKLQGLARQHAHSFGF